MLDRKHHAIAAILTLLLLTSGLVTAAPAGSPAAGRRVDEMIAAGRYAQAGKQLRKRLGQKDIAAGERLPLTVQLARVLRLGGEPAAAVQELEALDFADKAASAVRLELGRCCLAAGETAKASETLALCRNDRDIPLRCLANFVAAGIDFDAKRYEPCIALLEQVLRDGAGISPSEVETNKELRDALADAARLLETARAELARLRYGEDYYHYRLARMAQARGDFRAAIREYGRITAPVLADAAGCYIPACEVRIGGKEMMKRAMKDYAAFIAGNESGLYREEARLHLALLRCRMLPAPEELKATRAELRRLLDWLEATGERPATDGNALAGVSRIVADFPVPAEFTRPNDAGALVRAYTAPETIVNRLTCPWYLDYLRLQALLLDVLLSFDTGDQAAAEAGVARLAEFERQTCGRLLSRTGIPERLRQGLADRAFLVPPESWEKLRGGGGMALKAACFFYLGGENDIAQRLFGDIAAAAAADPRSAAAEEAAVASFGLGCCAFRAGKDSDACAAFDRVRRDFKQAAVCPLASLLLANIYSGTPGKTDDAFRVYRQIAADHRRSPVAPRALLCLAISACNLGKPDLALQSCRELDRLYPGTIFARSARTIGDRLAAASGEADAGLPEPDADDAAKPGLTGRVLPVRKHLVLPGGGSLAHEYRDLRPDDILRYDVSCSPRTSCTVIRRFALRLSELEPQVPPAKGKSLAFLRAPVLFDEATFE
ncbi:MAG: hypothetical protein A3K18_23340 [Lentisphaerae bacterium RIFOXYA12_64_32]|nr:MAG: hypothetical protein A3K18_23340 [Lentisphaerae bacterium RIFOXYA12_64_32]